MGRKTLERDQAGSGVLADNTGRGGLSRGFPPERPRTGARLPPRRRRERGRPDDARREPDATRPGGARGRARCGRVYIDMLFDRLLAFRVNGLDVAIADEIGRVSSREVAAFVSAGRVGLPACLLPQAAPAGEALGVGVEGAMSAGRQLDPTL